MRSRQTKQEIVAIIGVFFTVVLAGTTTLAQTEAPASPSPTATPTTPSRVSSAAGLISPGRIDFQHRHTSLTDQYNFFWGSPVFKGGFGFISSDGKGMIEYQGAFFRPLLPFHKKDDLIVGLQRVHTKTETSWEFQTEYRFGFGLGFGGGFVRRSNHALDISFGKMSYRKKHPRWKYILEAQAQNVFSKTSLGGYAALYDETLMLTVGTDNEQWRASFGYIAKNQGSRRRPAVEFLYVDHDIGRLRGLKTIFINGTFSYYGRFLSHEARLGRAMGPTGLEFGNPNGFLSPTPNLRLEVWALGDLVDYRLERVSQPNGVTTGRYEVTAFPSQFDQRKSWLDRFFGGLIYIEKVRQQSGGNPGWLFWQASRSRSFGKKRIHIRYSRERGFIWNHS